MVISVKKVLMMVLILCMSTVVFAQFNPDEHILPEGESVEIYIFHGQGCPHCSKALSWFEEISPNYPHVNIHEKEVYFDDENRELFEKFCYEAGTSVQGVPTIFVEDRMFVGFSNEVRDQIESEIQSCIMESCVIEDCEACVSGGQVNDPLPRDVDPVDPKTETYHSLIGTLFLMLVGLAIVIYFGHKYAKKTLRRGKKK
jgi:glutaredoxin